MLKNNCAKELFNYAAVWEDRALNRRIRLGGGLRQVSNVLSHSPSTAFELVSPNATIIKSCFDFMCPYRHIFVLSYNYLKLSHKTSVSIGWGSCSITG